MVDQKTNEKFSLNKARSAPLTKQDAIEAMTAMADQQLQQGNKATPAHKQSGVAAIAEESRKDYDDRSLSFQCNCACPKASDVLVSVISALDTTGISISVTQPNI